MGELPPFVTLAVNLTVLPLQILLASETILMDGVTVVQKTKPGKLPVPFAFVTAILPLVPEPTTAVIEVELTTENELAAVPPNITAVVPVKFVPVIAMVVPAAAVVGVNDEMVGDPLILIVT